MAGSSKDCEPGKNVYSAQFVTVYKHPCCRHTSGIFNLKYNTVKIHKLQAKERAGPWSGHNVMKWCVCVLPSFWCVSVSVGIGTGAKEERGRHYIGNGGSNEPSMHVSNIHQKSTFHLTVNFFSDLCTKHSQVSSYELVIESEYHFLNEKCVKHCFSVSD